MTEYYFLNLLNRVITKGIKSIDIFEAASMMVYIENHYDLDDIVIYNIYTNLDNYICHVCP